MNTADRTVRIHLRAKPQQKALLRLAAEVSKKSMTDFIVESACHAAEQTLLDQRPATITGSQSKAQLSLPDRPAHDNAGLSDLFLRRPPWAE